MNIQDAKRFITTYEKYYFDREPNGIQNYTEQNIINDLGRGNRITTINRESEDYICTQKLDTGLFDKYAFAWKSGKFRRENNRTQDELFMDADSNDTHIYRRTFDSFPQEQLNTYFNNLRELNHDDFQIGADDNENYERILDFYEQVISTAPDHFGPIYAITAMFFLSQGRLPIFDSKAFIAVKALTYDVSPCFIYVESGNPKQTKSRQVINKYYEYIRLLKYVFPAEQINQNNKFISRSLDRALWVYGHIKDENTTKFIYGHN